MMCEICGVRDAKTKVNMDGLTLQACTECSKFGKNIRKPVKRRKRSREIVRNEILPDYDKRIRKARVSRGFSRKELAGNLQVKESVLAKVESGRMLPDDKLARKLEKSLDIRLRGSVTQGEGLRKDLPEATLGDVAVVKKQ